MLWKLLRHKEICTFSPLGSCGWLWLVVVKRCAENRVEATRDSLARGALPVVLVCFV